MSDKIGELLSSDARFAKLHEKELEPRTLHRDTLPRVAAFQNVFKSRNWFIEITFLDFGDAVVVERLQHFDGMAHADDVLGSGRMSLHARDALVVVHSSGALEALLRARIDRESGQGHVKVLDHSSVLFVRGSYSTLFSLGHSSFVVGGEGLEKRRGSALGEPSYDEVESGLFLILHNGRESRFGSLVLLSVHLHHPHVFSALLLRETFRRSANIPSFSQRNCALLFYRHWLGIVDHIASLSRLRDRKENG